MARKTKSKRKQYHFPQTPFHKLVYGWLILFKRDGDLWDMLTALRSCDSEYSIKEYTTERLRAVLGLNADILTKCQGRRPGSNPFALNKQEQTARDKILASTPEHFQAHWKFATDAVRYATGYDLNIETYVKGKR